MDIVIAVRDWSDTKKMGEVVSIALDEFGIVASVGFSTGLRSPEACRADLPAIFIDDVVVFQGRIPKREEVVDIIRSIHQD